MPNKKVPVKIERIVKNATSLNPTIILQIDGRELNLPIHIIDTKSIQFDKEKGEGKAMIEEWWIVQRGLYHCCL